MAKTKTAPPLMVPQTVTAPSAGDLDIGYAEVSGTVLDDYVGRFEQDLVEEGSKAFPSGEIVVHMLRCDPLHAARYVDLS